MRTSCSTCYSVTWAAKNDNFCTDCERRWYMDMNCIYLGMEGENPLQPWVDAVFDEAQKKL